MRNTSNPNIHYTTIQVIENKQLSSTLYLIRSKIKGFFPHPQPPQFIMLWVPGYEAIPMSIAGYNDENKTIDIIVKPIGPTTRYLAGIRKGAYLGIYGPLGKPLVPSGKKFLLLAGGSGIAPIAHYVTALRCGKENYCKVIFGAWTKEEVGNVGEYIQSIGAEVTTVCDEGCDYKGTVVDVYRDEDKAEYDAIISSGPLAMSREVYKHTPREVLDRLYIVFETHVKCGLGVCGSCVIPGTSLLLCVDGPAFLAKQIEKVMK